MTKYFANQERARRNTALLIIFFAITVIAIGVAIYTLIRYMATAMPVSSKGTEVGWWDARQFFFVMVAVGGFIGGSSLIKLLELRQGGSVVAQIMGGRRVNPNTDAPLERRLYNVVEEMAIASGIPVPGVYLMDQEIAINAFAAGHNASDAAVAVTKGALQGLSRDQLQGVIAHEFSHILNGDMRLNIRLMGVLFGIMAIHSLGRTLMRARVGRKGRVAFVVFIGAGLALIGWIGVLLGRIIQCAVSRQREYLADASAVQFTRNPEGIAGALKRILETGSVLVSPHTAEVGHLLFCDGLGFMGRLLATHPPLEERIRRLEAQSEILLRVPSDGLAFSTAGLLHMTPEKAIARLGHVTNDLGMFIQHVPQSLLERLRDGENAGRIVLALSLDRSTIESQRDVLSNFLKDPHDVEMVFDLYREIERLGSRARLPLLEMAIPALRTLDVERINELMQTIEYLVASDRHISLFEFVLLRLLRERLKRTRGGTLRPRMTAIRDAAICLLQVVALLGGNNRERAFQTALRRLGFMSKEVVSLVERSPNELDVALDLLAKASLTVRKTVLEAVIECIMTDGEVSYDEFELLRAITVSLDVPMPPLPGQVI